MKLKDLKELLKWGRKYWFWMVLSLVLTILVQFLYSYIPLLIQEGLIVLGSDGSSNLPEFIKEFIHSESDVLKSIFYVCVCIVSLQTGRLIMRFFDNYLKGRLTENIAMDMRVKLYNHIDELSYTYHNHADNGDLIQRCTSDIDTSSGFLSNKIPEIVNLFATIAVGAYQVGSINITLMWVSMLLLPVSAISSIIYFRYVNKTFEKIEESESKMMTIIEENLAGARVVRAFAAEKYEIDKLDKQNKDYHDKSYRFNKAMALFWGLSDCSVMLQCTATMGTGIYLAYTHELGASDIVAALMLMGMLIWPIRSLGRWISDYGKTIVAIKRIDEVLNEPSEFENSGTKKPEIKGNVEFKNVSFKFLDDDKSLLKNVSFKVESGQTVAIIGKTGAGKSTVANLLTRLLDYDSGDILIEGIPIKEIDKKYLRKNIGMVLQDPFLFSKTIYENISIVNKNIPEDRIYDAARTAAIHDDISSFEKGYSTMVGEKGTTLSGGQKQRMAIARMLVEEKTILIFDDSLSAVDTETDLMIRRALKKNKSLKTIFIITHRITTAKEADKIIVLENGEISAIGTHDELSKKPGLYQKLWEIQGNLENEFIKVLKEGR